MKWIKRLVSVLAVLLVLIQFVRPARTNPPVDPARTIEANTQVTPEIAAILRTSCYDCHSFESRWPWYSQVAPASWLLVWDVNEAREKFSFSDWAKFDRKKASHVLEEMSEEVSKGDMPPAIYLTMHADARLSDVNKSKLLNWISEERARLEAKSN